MPSCQVRSSPCRPSPPSPGHHRQLTAPTISPSPLPSSLNNLHRPSSLTATTCPPHSSIPPTRLLPHPPSSSSSPAPPLPPPTVITSLTAHLTPTVLANALLLIDKPPQWEAAEVLTAVQRATRAPKVASLAPLEPAASGLMLIAFGAATRLARRVETAAKRYEGVILLGGTGAAADVRASSYQPKWLPWDHITDEELQEAADSLLEATEGGAGEVVGEEEEEEGERLPESSARSGGGGGGVVVSVLPLRYRLRQVPGSGSFVEEDRGPSITATRLQLRELRVWRSPEDAQPQNQNQNGGTDPWVGRIGPTTAAPLHQLQAGPGSRTRIPTDGGRMVRFSMLIAGRGHIRSLIVQYGRRLRTSACLAELRRTAVGTLGVDDGWSLESLLPALEAHKEGDRR